MQVCTATIEFALASKFCAKLVKQEFGHYVVIREVMNLVMSQGFGQEYAQAVAEEAWDQITGA